MVQGSITLRSAGAGSVRGRITLVLAVIGYVIVFNLAYRSLVVPTFESWGLGYHQVSSLLFWTSAIVCVIPALWMPVEFTRPSLLLFYVQYFLIFIPATFIAPQSLRPELSEHDALSLLVVMFVGISIVQGAYLVPALRLRVLRVSPETFWLGFSVLTGITLSYLILTLGGSFQLVNFHDVYDLRTAMNEALAATGTRFGFYAQTLLLAALLPLLFADGMYRRRWWVIVPVSATYLFIFGIGGAKAAALGIVYLPAAFVLMSRPPRRIPLYVLAALATLLLSGFATQAILSQAANISYLAVVHFRLFSVPPLTIPQYFDFFQSHPVTHLSHVTGIRSLLEYPYVLDIPYTVGGYFYGFEVGLNSGFWAADGLAGFGMIGIPLISVVCAALFWLVDSVSADLNATFVGLLLIFCTVFFGNVSLFTTLITGGLLTIMVMVAVAPRDGRGLIRSPSLSFLRKIPSTIG